VEHSPTPFFFGISIVPLLCGNTIAPQYLFSLTRIVGRENLAMRYLQNEINFYAERGACSLGWWLMTGADLFWEKSIASWLLLVDLL
jgi:hypothetical protein